MKHALHADAHEVRSRANLLNKSNPVHEKKER